MITTIAQTSKRGNLYLYFSLSKYFLSLLLVGLMGIAMSSGQVIIEVEVLDYATVNEQQHEMTISRLCNPFVTPEMQAYPNPFSNSLQLDLEANSQATYIDLVKTNGEIVFESEITSLPAVFSLSTLDEGTYYVQVYTNNGVASKLVEKE